MLHLRICSFLLSLAACYCHSLAPTVLFLPLDERYTIRQLFLNLAQVAGEQVNVLTPPLEMICHQKTAADLQALDGWLEESAHSASAAVISAELYIYGGLIQSRISNASLDVVSSRLQKLQTLKQRFPHLKVFVSSVVMRIPAYNGDFEEPWYWAQSGRSLFEFSFFLSKFRADGNPTDNATSHKWREMVPPAVVDQFLWRRQRNQAVLQHMLSGMTGDDGDSFDTLLITLDDNALYGLNIDEANQLKRQASALGVLNNSVRIYPGADEVGATLLARCLSDAASLPPGYSKPRLRIVWRNVSANDLIPNYEGQPVRDTVMQQVLAAGALPCNEMSDSDCDGTLLVNNFAATKQLEASEQPPAGSVPLSDYGAFENISFDLNAVVSFADVRYSNGGDLALVKWMGLHVKSLSRVGFAGWNTDGNSLGTAIANLILLILYSGPTRIAQANIEFNLLRLTEDVAYQTLTRPALNSYITSLTTDAITDLSKDLEWYKHFVLKALQKSFNEFKTSFGNDTARHLGTVTFPWNRTFEVGIFLSATSGRSTEMTYLL